MLEQPTAKNVWCGATLRSGLTAILNRAYTIRYDIFTMINGLTGPFLMSYSVFVLVFPFFSFLCSALDAGHIDSFWAHVSYRKSYRRNIIAGAAWRPRTAHIGLCPSHHTLFVKWVLFGWLTIFLRCRLGLGFGVLELGSPVSVLRPR